MAEENRILIRTNPTITPNLINMVDLETEDADKKDRKLMDGNRSEYRQQRGRFAPLVKIGNSILPDNNMRGLILRQEELVPEITLTFTDENFAFTTRKFPLTNIIVSIFIRSTVSTLKSFAGDFIINSVSSMPVPGSTMIVYTISGELYIPKLYGNYSKAYRDLSSLGALQKIAEELQLGFADNQADGTDDIMTWINPNDTYSDFIKHIVKFAYKNDNNFFDCFIDRYYVLNFVNVEKQFARDEDVDTGYVARDQSLKDKSRTNPDTQEDDIVEVPIILSNYPDLFDSEFYIKDFKLVSNHGEILKRHAIRKYSYWYEHGSAEPTGEDEPTEIFEDPPFRLFYLDPLISSTTSDGKSPQTAQLDSLAPTGEDDPTVTQGVWSGIDYGNAHPSYKYAELLNHHNRLETEKNMLNVTLGGFSTNVMRGSRVKVEIFIDKTATAFANVAAEDFDPENESILNELDQTPLKTAESPSSMIRDESLSDFYYVKTISYTFKDGEYTTNLELSRRHWLLPPQNQIYV